MWAPSLVSLLLLLSGCDTSGSAGVPPAPPTLPLAGPTREVAGETPALPRHLPVAPFKHYIANCLFAAEVVPLELEQVASVKNGSSRCRGTSRWGRSRSNALRRRRRSR